MMARSMSPSSDHPEDHEVQYDTVNNHKNASFPAIQLSQGRGSVLERQRSQYDLRR